MKSVFDLSFALKKRMRWTELDERFKEKHDIILVTGCFDVLHRGHFELLKFASIQSQKPIVMVGVNSDEAVLALKGDGRPINNESDRQFAVDLIRPVQCAFIIYDTTVTQTITTLRPDVWVKGSDWTMETLNQDEVAAAKQVGAQIIFAHKLEGYSSTKIIERMRQ